jgi:stage V sporulation protein D (sporulation-specific penicillin-binding protein)
MSDILPYLGVQQNWSEEDVAGKTITMGDLTGLTAKEAQKLLKEQSLSAVISGSGDTVTAQIPAAGQSLPGGSQVLLYLGEAPTEDKVAVPNFVGMTRQQASDAAGSLGLYILPKGNLDISPGVTAAIQSVPPGTEVSLGTTIEITFTDPKAAD